MAKKQLKTLIRSGASSGYLWSAAMPSMVFPEAEKLLSEEQYEHCAGQVRDLAMTNDPTHSLTVDVRPIEDYHEIRDKGGVLFPLNIRIYFGVDKDRSVIVILGVVHKQNDGPTLLGVKVKMRGRWRKYRNGDYGFIR